MLHTARTRSIHCNFTRAVNDIEPTLVTRTIRNYGMGVSCFANYGAKPSPQSHISLPTNFQVDLRAACSHVLKSNVESSVWLHVKNHKERSGQAYNYTAIV